MWAGEKPWSMPRGLLASRLESSSIPCPLPYPISIAGCRAVAASFGGSEWSLKRCVSSGTGTETGSGTETRRGGGLSPGRVGAGAACYRLLVADGIRIVFADVAKRFDERVVFRSVAGEAAPGEVLAVTGPNGSGKSTLLAILSGLLRATKGSVRYLQGDGSELERAAWRQVLGAVAPAMSVYEELDAMENLRFFARVRGLRDADDRCRSCLERVGLDPGRQTLVAGFSTGMHQRLKIAQAMLHRPPVLFLDEPGSNLDPDGRVWLEGWVLAEQAAGTTVVLATNDPREMEWGTKRVALAL